MTEENALPELGEHDWTSMEQLANGVPTSDVDSPGYQQVVLTDEMISKRVLWDVAPHDLVEEIGDYLGLTKASDEGVEMEHTEAHGRMMETMSISPYIHMVSTVAARTILATMLVMEDQTEAVPLDSAEFADNVTKFESVIFAANLSAISELVEWGLLHTPQFVSMEPEDVEQLMREAQEEGNNDSE